MSGVTMMMMERPKRLRGSARFKRPRGAAVRATSAGAISVSAGTASSSSIGLEDIARSAHRLDAAREFRVLLDLAPEPRHLHVDGADIAAELRLFGEGLARDGVARARRQRGEQRRLGGEVHRLLAAEE